MTPRTYWLGWITMAVVFIAVVAGACWFVGAKIDALIEVMRGR